MAAPLVRRQQDLRGHPRWSGQAHHRRTWRRPDGKAQRRLDRETAPRPIAGATPIEEISARIVREFPGYAELVQPGAAVDRPRRRRCSSPTRCWCRISASTSTRATCSRRRAQKAAAGTRCRWATPTLPRPREDGCAPACSTPTAGSAPKPYDLDAAARPVRRAARSVRKLLRRQAEATGGARGSADQPPVPGAGDPKKPDAGRWQRNVRYLKAAGCSTTRPSPKLLPSVASLRALRNFAKTSRATRAFHRFPGDPLFQRSVRAQQQDDAPRRRPYPGYYNGTEVDLDILLPRPAAAAGDRRRVLAGRTRATGASDGDVRGSAPGRDRDQRSATRRPRISTGWWISHHPWSRRRRWSASERTGAGAQPAGSADRAETMELLTASRVARLTLDARLGGTVGVQYRGGRRSPAPRDLSGSGAGVLLRRSARAFGVALAGQIGSCGQADHDGVRRTRQGPGIGRAEAAPRDAATDRGQILDP